MYVIGTIPINNYFLNDNYTLISSFIRNLILNIFLCYIIFLFLINALIKNKMKIYNFLVLIFEMINICTIFC